MICKNCKHNFKLNYCNKCGQRKVTGRLSYKELLAVAFDSFNIEKGLLFTLKSIFLYPNILILDYLKGRRKIYYNPIKLFFIITSIKVVIFTFFSNEESVDIRIMNSPIWIISSFLFFIPMFSIFTFLINKKKYNFVENITINLFVFSGLNLIDISVFVIRKLLINVKFDILGLILIFILPLFFLYSFFYRLQRKTLLTLLHIIAYWIVYLLFILLISFFYEN